MGVAWNCYTGEARLGKTLWQKTHALLSTLYRMYPSRTFYVKMDVDALLLPRSLLQYLNFLHEASSRHMASQRAARSTDGREPPPSRRHSLTRPPPVYFGSSAQASG